MKKIIAIAAAFSMLLGMSIPAFASSADIDGTGYIAENGDSSTDVVVDVTLPYSFLWYADNTTSNGTTFDIVSGIYEIENNSTTVDVQVAITDYSVTSGGSSSINEANVTLNLTGALSGDGYGQDLFGGSTTFGIYTAILASTNGANATAPVGDSTWQFGFDGTYNGSTLPASVEQGSYTIGIELTAYSLS